MFVEVPERLPHSRRGRGPEPHARRWYQVVITTNPAPATWEAPFDDGVTVAWRVHPDRDGTGGGGSSVGEKADATGTVAVIHTLMRPDLRVIDAPDRSFRQTQTAVFAHQPGA